MSVKLLTEHHLEFLSLTGGCIGSSGSTLVKMPHCWKSHVAAHIYSGLVHTTAKQTEVILNAHSCTRAADLGLDEDLHGPNDSDLLSYL